MIRLVLGGARSGKSEVAEAMAGRAPAPVAYVATATGGGGDPEWTARIAAHRARRPPWSVAEAAGRPVGAATVLVDSLGVWLAGVPDFASDVGAVAGALAAVDAEVIVVSDEVGLGVHPASAAGRQFRDALGALNRAVADAAGEVVLVVAGRVLPLGRP
jgi:adenosyl cobinamide kinase/adenosyl cobinamide phosphate guanylyltransferase